MPEYKVDHAGKVYRKEPHGSLTRIRGPQAKKIFGDLVAKTKAEQELAEALSKDADENVGTAGEAPEWA